MLVILLAPHQNCRYQASVEQLSRAELELTLRAVGIDAQVNVRAYAGHNALCVQASEDDERLVRLLGRMSSMYMTCRAGEDGALYPMFGRLPAMLGEDLSGILKYKGKTNESFTRMLLNVARLSSAYALEQGPLDVFDPVCGKGTGLLEALNAGDNAMGVDVDGKALVELQAFLKRYLTYHRLKHGTEVSSLTAGGKPRRLWQLHVAADAAAFKAGDKRTLSVAECDTLLSDKLMPRRRFHIIAGDLPYGVQHATHSADSNTAFSPAGKGAQPRAKSVRIDQFTAEAVPVWARMLRPGGAMALSFNAYTLSRDVLREQMRRCNLEVMEGGPYDAMRHWVEQAVDRDIAVGVKPRS